MISTSYPAFLTAFYPKGLQYDIASAGVNQVVPLIDSENVFWKDQYYFDKGELCKALTA